nr:hypothetical protein [Bacteroidota bacterium]
EIYYPNHLNQILIAGSVMRIVPSKTKELWPIPENSKVIASTDLITERNISQPSKIIVRSATRSFEVNKGMKPMFSPKVEVFSGNEPKLTISGPPSGMPTTTYETIFYGRGRGIHSTTPFGGYLLKDVLANQVKYDADNITNGILIIAAEDGYRAVFTYSEVFNRNDQAEVLLVYEPENANGGAFKLFPAGDFFSDRAIKSVNSIHFESAK